MEGRRVKIKCGIEFHQMLNTKNKLFCNCPTILRKDDPDIIFKRKLRPTRSELGEVDPAALFEFKKGYTYVYEAYSDTTCLVEMDEEPPHDLNREALEISLMIALMLNSRPVDEVFVMRKIVIDGSNTTGFQRTALISTGGQISIDGKTIRIQTICLEEDAARKISENAKTKEIIYRLDRLGIPLIEIATAPDIESPEEAEKVAYKIGQLLRITGRVKRGLGTIRQDLNISVEGGARVEIKGVQKIELIKLVVANEIQRQLNLLKIRDELEKRGLKLEEIRNEFVDVTEVFTNTSSKMIKKALSRGGKVLALKLPKFKGLIGREIQPGRRLGTEFADRARYWGGVGGIIHSDELPGYGIGESTVQRIREILNCKDLDAFVIVADSKDKCIAALEAVAERAREAVEGVPNETRAANPDGTTRYSRPMPGKARMYPETDIRPIRLSPEFLDKVRRNLPEMPEQKLDKFIHIYGLNETLAKQMLNSYHLDIFEYIVEKIGVSATLVANTLENIMKSLRREGYPIENIKDEKIIELFKHIKSENIAKEAIPEILAFLSQNPDASIEEALDKLGLRGLSPEELEKIVEEVLQKNKQLIASKGERAMGAIMGDVMKIVRGKIDGRTVSEVVRVKLKSFLDDIEATS